MKKLKIIIVFVFVLNSVVFAQPITIDWQKSFGSNATDQAYSVALTADGGFIVAGNNGAPNGDVVGNIGAKDFWIIKLNANGNLIWKKCFGGISNDVAESIKRTNDGGFIIGGFTYSNDTNITNFHGGLIDGWLLKIDSDGNIQWEKAYGGSSQDYIRCIVLSNDGGFIVSGESMSSDGDLTINHGDFDGWVMKLTSAGSIVWSKSYGGPGPEQIRGIIPTKDSGYILAGSSGLIGGDITSNHGLLDCWILKLDFSGNLVWQKNYGGSDYDLGWSIAEKLSNGYIVASHTISNDFDVHGNKGSWDIWLLNLNANGDTLGTKTYGGSGDDISYVIENINDTSFLVGGQTESLNGDVSSTHGQVDCWLFLVNLSGNIIWEQTFGGSQNEWINDVQKTNDGYIFVGASLSNDYDLSSNNGNEDYWIVKLLDDNINEVYKNTIEKSIHIFPNPTTETIEIDKTLHSIQSIKLYDSMSNLLYESKTGAYNYNFSFLPKGLYILELKTSQEIIKQKLIIQ